MIREFTKNHPYFVVLFIILFGADVLNFLYLLIIEGASLTNALFDLAVGFVAVVIVLYVGLKLMGDWRVEDKDPPK